MVPQAFREGLTEYITETTSNPIFAARAALE